MNNNWAKPHNWSWVWSRAQTSPNLTLLQPVHVAHHTAIDPQFDACVINTKKQALKCSSKKLTTLLWMHKAIHSAMNTQVDAAYANAPKIQRSYCSSPNCQSWNKRKRHMTRPWILNSMVLVLSGPQITRSNAAARTDAASFSALEWMCKLPLLDLLRLRFIPSNTAVQCSLCHKCTMQIPQPWIQGWTSVVSLSLAPRLSNAADRNGTISTGLFHGTNHTATRPQFVATCVQCVPTS